MQQQQHEQEWRARQAQVKRDLEAAIAETQAEIHRLEAFLAETREAEQLQGFPIATTQETTAARETPQGSEGEAE